MAKLKLWLSDPIIHQPAVDRGNDDPETGCDRLSEHSNFSPMHRIDQFNA